jgi:hypothetical protein
MLSGAVGRVRTFLDLPGRDVALGHRRRKRRHVEVLSSQRGLSSVQCYTDAISDSSMSDRQDAHLSERRGCAAAAMQRVPTPYMPQREKPWETNWQEEEVGG